MRGDSSARTGAEVIETIAVPSARPVAALSMLVWLLAPSVMACSAEPIAIDGQYGRNLALAHGDGSVLPRLAFIDEGCPGETAAGGCDPSGSRQCRMLLIDSLAPLSVLRDPEASAGSRLSIECLEVRPAGTIFAELEADATDEERMRHERDLQDAVARFRFDELPLVRAADADDWSWTAGNQSNAIEPDGVLGGNLLRNFAVAIRTAGPDDATVTLYGEFPGSETILADQGRAFLPVQFPGRLLGRELSDRCEVEDGPCDLPGFDISTSAPELPLQPSRMVMDACVAIPPCAPRYLTSPDDPFGPGMCDLTRGPSLTAMCDEPTDPILGGFSASLVVATGVPGLVLFSDSAARMFGDLEAMPPCPTPISPTTEIDGTLPACLIGNDGVLHFAGWPSAGEDAPLLRLRVRSLALVPGADRSRAKGPCERADERRDAAHLQCLRYQKRAELTGDIRDAAPPYSAEVDEAEDLDGVAGDQAGASLAVLGEPFLEDGSGGPRPSHWIPTTVLPADHPLALAVRRDVAPEALEPDGLLGTALFPGTEAVLDYTDLNPSLRLSCLAPHDGRCQVLPECHDDRQTACCHGLPRTLLDELIRLLDDDTCCGAVSARDLAELQQAGHCVRVPPP
ncbi:hypothetical protein [Paraliomyxa miuraensis]|uniref:hypothetical protein n=1 Tax=Paraliomyxa miuraensis TaxID=376150 RepID=UPI002257A28B|nr:hypothetical protein [Paraliomyxa miuraensis]MCX4244452.1 hypothetical protein [Paraliomyxa miuraensis]